MGNQIKTVVLLTALTVFILIIGQLLGGRQGMVIAFFFAVVMNFGSYWFSDKIVLRMYGAQEITRDQAPQIYDMVETLTRQAGLPMPKVCVIPKDSANAFATGRNPDHAVVAVTEGLLNLLNREELMGVLAHELAHVKNRDILIGSIAATMAGAIMLLANMARWSAIFGGSDDEDGGFGILGTIILSIIAPLAAMIIQMWISRTREYMADNTGAKIAGTPDGLASALEKLGMQSKRVPMQAQPATAHMFIVNPLSGGGFTSWFSTHPPLEERISRLRGQRFSPGHSEDRNAKSKDNMRNQGENFWNRLR